MDYVCIMAKIQIENATLDSLLNFNNLWLTEMLLSPGKVLYDLMTNNFISEKIADSIVSGDGVVPLNSQNLSEGPYFVEHQIPVTIIPLDNTDHFEACFNHATILLALKNDYIAR